MGCLVVSDEKDEFVEVDEEYPPPSQRGGEERDDDDGEDEEEEDEKDGLIVDDADEERSTRNHERKKRESEQFLLDEDDYMLLQDNNITGITRPRPSAKKAKTESESDVCSGSSDDVDDASGNKGTAEEKVQSDHLDHDAVMNLPGFHEGALLAALGHLMEHKEMRITFTQMTETRRVRWVVFSGQALLHLGQ